MLDLDIRTDDFGRLMCTLSDGNVTATATASNIPDAAADLLSALDQAALNGIGECFWLRASGVFRWLLRREQGSARLVVLWSAGTLTGWEHVFAAECDWAALERMIRHQIDRYEVSLARPGVDRPSLRGI